MGRRSTEEKVKKRSHVCRTSCGFEEGDMLPRQQADARMQFKYRILYRTHGCLEPRNPCYGREAEAHTLIYGYRGRYDLHPRRSDCGAYVRDATNDVAAQEECETYVGVHSHRSRMFVSVGATCCVSGSWYQTKAFCDQNTSDLLW